ncbi:MAG: hypothetical protein JXR77_18835, partial [Lentisphaeria bacterium]|nr:hypothetical protein [Lentisphaeria bacterium]
MDRIEANKAFLTSIYRKEPFAGHAFACRPELVPVYAGPDNEYTTSDRPVSEWVPWVVENYRRRMAFLESVPSDEVPTCDLSTGTQIYAAAFGCPVHRNLDSNPCALPRVFTAAEADALSEPDIWSAPSLYRVFELADAVRRELGPDVPLGPPDKQTGFDTACLVWEKTGIYAAMLTPEEKGAVKRLTARCTSLLIRFLRELRREFPTMTLRGCPGVWTPPEMPPWYSNDECGAFGTALFEEFCLPELIELSEAFGGLGMHCCADADHQFPLFRRIPGFYAFNRVPAKQGRQGLRPILEHLGGPEGPVHVLSWLPDATIEALLREAPEGTRFIFLRQGGSADDARAWLDRMRALRVRTEIPSHFGEAPHGHPQGTRRAHTL